MVAVAVVEEGEEEVVAEEGGSELEVPAVAVAVAVAVTVDNDLERHAAAAGPNSVRYRPL